jgi:ferredoxin
MIVIIMMMIMIRLDRRDAGVLYSEVGEGGGAAMRISVDADRCSGHGRCYAVSPEVYTSDDEGYCAEQGTNWDVGPELAAAARAGAEACPEGAITVDE